jgi:hypothetical protein
VQDLAELRHHRGDAAGMEERLEQVLAGGAEVGQAPGTSRAAWKSSSVTSDPEPPGQREQVHDGVRRAADGLDDPDRVLERRLGHDVARPQSGLGDLDGSARRPARTGRGGRASTAGMLAVSVSAMPSASAATAIDIAVAISMQ